MPDERPAEELIELARLRAVRGRGPRFRMPVIERLRAARGLPQAVVKVTSFTRGKVQLDRHLRYISRDGDLPIETDRGVELRNGEDRETLVENWAINFDGRKRGRDTAEIVFSMPPGSDVEALRGAVRSTARKMFPDHEWVFAVHEDRSHPHVHLVVQMRGREPGQKLRLRKEDLYKLRATFAEASREQGVELAASSRATRGVGRRGIRRKLYEMRKRGVVPQVERKAVDAMSSSSSDASPTPWEIAMESRNQEERKAFANEAAALRKAAEASTGQEREKLARAADDLEKFGQKMPTPRTRRQQWLKRLKSMRRDQTINQQKSPEKDRDGGKSL